MVQPELAQTLERLQKFGVKDFYEGQTAKLIADDMQAHNGLITLEDLKNYKPHERVPLRGKYRGYDIISMPPPSSGGIAMFEVLICSKNMIFAQWAMNLRKNTTF